MASRRRKATNLAPAVRQDIGELSAVRFRLLSMVAEALLQGQDPFLCVLPRLFAEISGDLQVQVSLAHVRRHDGTGLHLACQNGADDRLMGDLATVGDDGGLLSTVIAWGEPICLAGGEGMPDPLRRIGLRAYVSEPLLADGMSFGSLSFGSRTIDGFDEEDRRFFSAIARQVALDRRHWVRDNASPGLRDPAAVGWTGDSGPGGSVPRIRGDGRRQAAAELADIGAGGQRAWHGPDGALWDRRRAGGGSETRLRMISDNLPDSAIAQYARNAAGQLRFLYLSSGFERLAGIPVDAAMAEADTFLDRIPAEHRAALAAAEAESSRTLSDLDFEFPVMHAAGDVRWIRLRSRPYRQRHGAIAWNGLLSDVTLRKEVEERLSLFNRELHHRVNNSLMTVQALALATAPSAPDVASFVEQFGARITAMANTHSLLTAGPSDTADLRALIMGELEPFDDGSGQRIVLRGSDVDLPASLAMPVGMAIHELATNAAKYGALSVSDGSVHVEWTVGDGPQLALTWTEENGPPVKPPARQGFGSQLLDTILAGQLKAEVSRQFLPEGLRVDLVLMLT